MDRTAGNALCRITLAAALAAGLPVSADAVERCATAGKRVSVTYPAREPYQLAQDRVAEDPQYRLVDGGQFRLNGAAPCPAPIARSGPGGTGSSYKTFIITPVYRPAAGRGAFHGLINATAKATNIQADLLHAVIAVESAYNSTAVSHKGAQGLMQLIPATAKLYAVSNPYDPAQNVRAGARYLRYLIAEFDNDLGLALAAYNAGPETVRRYRNTIPPYPETRDYVQRVIQHYHRRLDLFSNTGS